MPEIYAIHPDNIRFLSSKSIELLKSAHDPFYGAFDAIDNARIGEGTVYEVRENEQIIGVFYLKYRFNHLGKIMELQYLGGELKKFVADLQEFLLELGPKQKCDEFIYLGRRGFARVFSILEEVGTVCRYKFQRV